MLHRWSFRSVMCCLVIAVSAATPHPANAQTTVSGDILVDTTWTAAGSPYDIAGRVTITDSASLVIEPGVVVRFGSLSGLDVAGRLVAVGTDSAPVRFTGRSSISGEWGGIAIAGTESAPSTTSILDHVVIEYGGAWFGACLTLTHAAVTVTHSAIRYSAGDGIRGSTGARLEASDTAFEGNGGFAVRLDDGSVDPDLARLSASGNGDDAVRVNGAVLSEAVGWEAAGIPYYIAGAVTVPATASLTIDAGVIATFAPEASLSASGPVSARGLAEAHILLTARDPGLPWYGVHLVGGPADQRSVFEYVTIEYGGALDANVVVDGASVRLRNSVVRGGAHAGVLARGASRVEAYESRVESNAGDAIHVVDAGIDPVLSSVALAGNGFDGVSIWGGVILESQRWELDGVRYRVGGVSVARGATLTIDPGVELLFRPEGGLEVGGTLVAAGTSRSPITFRGADGFAGPWQGIRIAGDRAAGWQNGGSILEHVTIEGAGGWYDASLWLDFARVELTNSTITGGDGDAIHADDAVGTTVQNVSLYGTGGPTNYAIRNDTPAASGVHPFGGDIIAANVWWGSPSGPTSVSCNDGGSGGRITPGVVFEPFLRAAPADVVSPVAYVEGYAITIAPERWRTPAGSLPVWLKATVRDGQGRPVPGQVVRVASTLGAVVDGGTTDTAGETFARVTSAVAGEATLSATVESAGCVPVLASRTSITFTGDADSGYVRADAPYFTSSIEIAPTPPIAGVPGVVRATFQNPNAFPVDVDASLGIAQYGVGLTFGPIGRTRVTLPANGSGTAAVPWTPPMSGHYCVDLAFHVTQSPAPSGKPTVFTGAAADQSVSEDGHAQMNVNVRWSALASAAQRVAAKRLQAEADNLPLHWWHLFGQVVSWLDPARHTYPSYDYWASSQLVSMDMISLVPHIPRPTLDGWWDDVSAAPGPGCAAGRCDNKYYAAPPGASAVTHSVSSTLTAISVPYGGFVTVTSVAVPEFIVPADGPVRELLETENARLRAHVEFYLRRRAAGESLVRYQQASAAGDEFWASQHAASYLHYRRELGSVSSRLADLYQRVSARLQERGVQDELITRDENAAFVTRIRDVGFNEDELRAAALLNFPDDALKHMRDRIGALDPDTLPRSVLPYLPRLAAEFRAFADELGRPDNFGNRAVASAAEGSAMALRFRGAVTEAPLASSGSELVRVHSTTTSFVVGNPFAENATIVLKPRAVELPPEWSVEVEPRTVTLAPGERTTATVTVDGSVPIAQGSRLRVAVEGFRDDRIMGGVVLDVVAPRNAAMAPSCDGTLKRGEGETCTCSLECGGSMLCARAGAPDGVCLALCDTTLGAGSCPHVGQTCEAIAGSANSGMCIPAIPSDPTDGAQPPTGGCGCGNRFGIADTVFLWLVPVLARRRPRARQA